MLFYLFFLKKIFSVNSNSIKIKFYRVTIQLIGWTKVVEFNVFTYSNWNLAQVKLEAVDFSGRRPGLSAAGLSRLQICIVWWISRWFELLWVYLGPLVYPAGLSSLGSSSVIYSVSLAWQRILTGPMSSCFDSFWEMKDLNLGYLFKKCMET